MYSFMDIYRGLINCSTNLKFKSLYELFRVSRVLLLKGSKYLLGRNLKIFKKLSGLIKMIFKGIIEKMSINKRWKVHSF